MEKAKLMQLEIEEKRKLPKNVKENIGVSIIQDLIAAVIIMIYFYVVNYSYYKYTGSVFEEHMKYIALGMILVTVIIFEISYRKNSVKLAIIGVELFSCGILSLYIPYIFLHTNSTFRITIMLLPIAVIIYYAIKAFIIYKQKKFQYQNNLSDVKEIVKDTEKVSYIDEESKKSFKEKKILEREIQDKIEKEQKIRRARKEEEKRNIMNKKMKKIKR